MLRIPRCLGAVSRLNQDGIAHEVDADSTRTGALLKVNGYRFRDLLLQITQIFPLRGNATRAIRIIPPRDEPARLLVTLDLKSDLFHLLETYYFIANKLAKELYRPRREVTI